MSVVTRFAPSPTGYLHIGGARTALFNYLFAKHHGGKFYLRIEDTDLERSTDAAKQAILDSMTWLGLSWDGDIYYQSEHAKRHADVAKELVENGHAYYCYASKEELEEMRAQSRSTGKVIRSPWRDGGTPPDGVAPVVRLKMPLTGETKIQDLVQGEITMAHEQLDDMVLLRSDGTPTYMLAVVVDDHDMGVTHIIRGDDHLNNAFRQYQIYVAMGWDVPQFAHVPLIHGADGAKLSKRHGAMGVGEYQDMGILPAAMNNYLLRLGWAHGDVELITLDEAIKIFDVDGIGKSPSRFDMDKMMHVNAHYIKQADAKDLADMITPRIKNIIGKDVSDLGKQRLIAGMDGLKERAKSLIELAQMGAFYARTAPVPIDPKAAQLLDAESRGRLAQLHGVLQSIEGWDKETVEGKIKEFCDGQGLKLGQIAQPLRAVLTGSTQSPSVFDIMMVLGKEETLARVA